MKDRTPVLYALQKLLNSRVPFQISIEKAEQFYNLSKEDKKILRSDVVGVLKHFNLLKLEAKTVFPKCSVNEDEMLLICIALFEMRKAKSAAERKTIASEISETIKSRGMVFDPEEMENLPNQAKKEFVIPEEYKDSTYKYNELVFNTPAWVIQRYDEEYGPEKALEILKSNFRIPSLYLSVNTRKAKLSDFESDERFTSIPTTNSAFKNGGSLLSNKPGRASNIKEVESGKLFAQDISYAMAVDALPLMQYYKAIHIGGKTGTTSSALAIRLAGLDGKVISPIEDEKNLARAKAMYRRLCLSNVEPSLSSTKMIKTYEAFDSFDIAVVTPTSTHLGQMKRRPDVAALFSIDQLMHVNKEQLNMLLEASYFPRIHGTLAYIVPSILKEEGEQIIDKFLNDPTTVNKYKLVTQKTIFPDGSNGYDSDGIYYAILVRIK